MPYFRAIFEDLWVQGALVLVVVGLALAIAKRPRNPVSRKHAIWFLWLVCFCVLASWIMLQQDYVLAGAFVPSAEQPIEIRIKGVVRYVAPVVAYRHDAGMLVLLLFGLSFFAAHKIARVDDEA